MAPEHTSNAAPAPPTAVTTPAAPSQEDAARLFHRLNNQLGIILANAELLESRLTEEPHRARAGQVVASALDAIATAQEIRRSAGLPVDGPTPPTRPSTR